MVIFMLMVMVKIVLMYSHSTNMAEVQKEAENLEPKPVEKVEEIVKDDANKVIPTVDLSKLPEHERRRIEHERLHAKHKGHETMHFEMMLVLLLTLFVAQIFLVQWKKRHFKSYQMVTLFGMWIIPVIFCLKLDWWRFIYIWVVWSVVNVYISYKATRKMLPGTTPRLVYRWFNLIYKVSYALGLIGYFVMMATLFGLNLLFLIRPEKCFDFGFLLIFYGLYYGVLGRDFAEICSESMASHIGYYTKSGLPGKSLDVNVCAICGNQMNIPFEEDEVSEKVYELSCNHRFHEFCIRGWCIVGKKQTCPYCKEKVDLKRMFKNFWERPHVLYGQLLDWIRYLVVWQPVIFILVQGINYLLGLE